VLAGIVQRFYLEFVPGQTVTPLAATTLRPLEGVKVVLRDRNRSEAFAEPRFAESMARGLKKQTEPARCRPFSQAHDKLSKRIGAALLGAQRWVATS